MGNRTRTWGYRARMKAPGQERIFQGKDKDFKTVQPEEFQNKKKNFKARMRVQEQGQGLWDKGGQSERQSFNE